MSKTESVVSGVRLTSKQEGEIENLVKMGYYVSASEFIRDAVREKLESLVVIKIRNIDRERAKKEIIQYLVENKEAYGSEIAEALNLDVDLVFDILKKLQNEGMVE